MGRQERRCLGSPSLDRVSATFAFRVTRSTRVDLVRLDAQSAGFYVDYQYQRACSFLTKMTTLIVDGRHPNFRGVGMIEVLNEPIGGQPSLVSDYYPNALKAVRDVEIQYNVAPEKKLNIQMMVRNFLSTNGMR